MKFPTHALLSVVVVFVSAGLLCGQETAPSQAAVATKEVATPDVASCPHLFTAGSSTSNTFLQYCVTDVGAITSIQTPFGHFQIGAGGEGYGLCQESPAVEYHDYAATWSTNWNAPQILSLTASTIKISRTTSDGNWTLVQTISKVATTGTIKIMMALTNNQSVDKVAYLVRFADVDPDGMRFDSTYAGGALQSTWSWRVDGSQPFHYGLQLLNAAKSPFSYQQGFATNDQSGPNACAFALNAAPGGVATSGDPMHLRGTAIIYAYAGNVPAHQTLTVTMNYRAI